MIRFLHTSDLHIGKRFGNVAEDLRFRLREARHGVIDRLAAAAHDGRATHILLAGDTFDTETPTPAILRQALAAMAAHPTLTWVMLPGNHDSLLAEALWDAVRANLPPNLILATAPAPIALDGATILPAPCTTRRPGRDLSEWMHAAPTADGTIRLGLAHGPVQSFSEDGRADAVIAPDRAEQSGLDYLALGDWHGQVRITPRTHYAGTPEPDRFKHDEPGRALLVAIAAPGALPAVTPVDTASFRWTTRPLHLLTGDDPARAAEALLPGANRRHDLLRLQATGRTTPAGRLALANLVEAAAPEFALLELDEGALAIDVETTDLDSIDRAGALRTAAQALLDQSVDAALAQADRDLARNALLRLFSLADRIEARA